MSWVEDAKREARETRDRAVQAAESRYREFLGRLDQLSASLRASEANGDAASGAENGAPDAGKSIGTTAALYEAFHALGEEFTRQQALDWVAEHYPPDRREASSAFAKLVRSGRGIEAVRPHTRRTPGTFKLKRETLPMPRE